MKVGRRGQSKGSICLLAKNRTISIFVIVASVHGRLMSGKGWP